MFKIFRRVFCTKSNNTNVISNEILNRTKNYPVIQPLTMSTTFQIKSLDRIELEPFTYSRASNPNRKLLEDNLASLEHGRYGLVFSSGLSAITSITKLLNYREKILASPDLYGGTKRYFNKLLDNPINYIDFNKISYDKLEKLISDDLVKIIWIETPSNPLLEITPFKKIGDICKVHNKILVIDNTFLSPIYQKPLDYNADIVVHSMTKYINGHSDIVMGGIVTNNSNIYNKLKFFQTSMGIIPSPFDCYMVNRSIKTLEIRMKKHQQNAIYISKKLVEEDKIDKVLYPGLNKEKIPCHMKGYGGMISFYLKTDYENTKKFLHNLKKIPIAESLGGVETLIEHPASMTHASLNIDEKNKLGITNNLIRLSVGIEDPKIIFEDIRQALNNIN